MAKKNPTPEDGKEPDVGEVRQPASEPEDRTSGSEPQVADTSSEQGAASTPVSGNGDGNGDAIFTGTDSPGESDSDTGSSSNEESELRDADLDFLSGQTTIEQLADERLADLQRVTAEYANYRKRTEAGRLVERERTTGDVVKGLLPVLDDLDRANKHGDLGEDTPFAAISHKLRAAVERLGVRGFGAVGDQFDHNIHEAVFQQPTPGQGDSTVLDVVDLGYYVGDTLLRAAKVVVAVPAE